MRRRRRLAATAALGMGAAAAALALVGFRPSDGDGSACGSRTAGLEARELEAWLRSPFSPTSPLNRPLAPDAAIDRRSDELVRGLAEVAHGYYGFVVALGGYTIPVYLADEGTRRYDVSLTAPWARTRRLTDVPIPRHARPDPEADGHMAILDPETGCEYDFWQARRSPDGRWSSSWANTTALDGSGLYADGASARASGFALLAGLIFPHELAQGRIPHALVFGYPHTRAGRPVAPATSSDGRSRRRDAIPQGARVRLDPTLDLDSLDLRPFERTIARALQEYGMFLADTSDALSLYAAHPQSYASDPYRELLLAAPYVRLDRIPVERFQVLRLPT